MRCGNLCFALSGAQKRAETLQQPCILGDHQHQAQNQKWSPTKGNKFRKCCLTLAFSWAQKGVEMLRHHCILGDPQCQARGAQSKLAT